MPRPSETPRATADILLRRPPSATPTIQVPAQLEVGLEEAGQPLRPVKLSQHFASKLFLSVLNQPSHKQTDLTREWKKPRTTAEFLRLWIDEWIDSGKGRRGSETPSKRLIPSDGPVAKAISSISHRNNLILRPVSGRLELWVSDFESSTQRSVEAATRQLSSLFVLPDRDAAHALVMFMLSEFRFKLGKCRTADCGRYFELRHINRTYPRGTFCEGCLRKRSLQSAIKATAQNRGTAELSLYRAAAKKFAADIRNVDGWWNSSALKKAIAAYLNGVIDSDKTGSLRSIYWSGPRRGITGKWVAHSKNRNGIEEALK